MDSQPDLCKPITPSNKRKRPVDDDGTAEDNDARHIPRPPNSFLLFRADIYRLLKMRELKVSPKVIGSFWHSLSLEERQPWIDKAEELKRLHYENHPDYRYQPRTKKAKNDEEEKNSWKPSHKDETSPEKKKKRTRKNANSCQARLIENKTSVSPFIFVPGPWSLSSMHETKFSLPEASGSNVTLETPQSCTDINYDASAGMYSSPSLTQKANSSRVLKEALPRTGKSEITRRPKSQHVNAPRSQPSPTQLDPSSNCELAWLMSEIENEFRQSLWEPEWDPSAPEPDIRQLPTLPVYQQNHEHQSPQNVAPENAFLLPEEWVDEVHGVQMNPIKAHDSEMSSQSTEDPSWSSIFQ